MDEHRRDSVIARLALVLVVVLVAVLLWPAFGERVTTWSAPVLAPVTAYWDRVVQRAAMEPPQREAPPQRPPTGMPALPPYPPPLALDLPPAPTQTATPPAAAPVPAAPAPVANDRRPREVAVAPKEPSALSEPAPVACATNRTGSVADSGIRRMPPSSRRRRISL